MANQRHPNQKLVAFALDKELLAALDTARQEAGQDRSAYIREAIFEKLEALKIPMESRLKDSPDRAGKTYRPRTITSFRAESKVNSKAASAGARLLKKASASVQGSGAK